MHIRIDYRNGDKRHIAYCSEYHKGKARNPKCHSTPQGAGYGAVTDRAAG